MATLYVENFPDALHKALKSRAKKNGRSMANEVALIIRTAVPTAADVRKRRDLYEKAKQYQARQPFTPGPFPSTEEMVREGREERTR
jgi:plasmid stability protein